MTADQANAAAKTIVEAYLRHPLAVVTGEHVQLPVDEDWSAEIPLRPVRSITSVTNPLTGSAVTYSLSRHWLTCLWGVDWVDVVYDHGWAEDEVPPIIPVVINSLAVRILANPGSVQSQRVGDVRVDYRGGGSPALTAEDENLLRRYRSGPGAVATLRTRMPVPPGFWPYHGDLP